ncbi:MAG: hypothetical protein BroJett021_41250 [Chloroflexota bacterium]|jgi:hypothetical protein|nr:hypothetical protein [Caldilinea sp.]GIK75137.1 MAG: hypothetical protein BroJett021_41250 [Chloroflexota bacterium]
MNRSTTNGEGAVYAAGVWLARVQYSVAENGSRITLRVCDGERDLTAPPIPATELLLELADGNYCWFRPTDGNPVSGTYTIYR